MEWSNSHLDMFFCLFPTNNLNFSFFPTFFKLSALDFSFYGETFARGLVDIAVGIEIHWLFALNMPVLNFQWNLRDIGNIRRKFMANNLIHFFIYLIMTFRFKSKLHYWWQHFFWEFYIRMFGLWVSSKFGENYVKGESY